MARRVREHAWDATPLGPLGAWPASLRAVVDLLLGLPGPATVLWGPAHVQIYNDAYVAIARERHPALLGRPVAEGWPDVFGDVIAPLLDAVRAGRSTSLTDLPVAFAAPDGGREERIFDTAWSPVRDETGAVAGALQTLREVTDRRRTQAALRASEGRFRALALAGALFTYRMSADWAQMHRLDGRGVLTDTAASIANWADIYLLPEDRPDIFAAIEDAIRRRGPFEKEHRVRGADGGVAWVLSRAVPILKPDGAVLEWFGAARNVTARKDAEDALKDSNARFQALTEAIEDVFYMTDLDRNALLHLSSGFERIWGRSRAELEANLDAFADTIHPDDRAAVADGKAAQHAGRPVVVEYRIVRPDGAIRWILDRSFPVPGTRGRRSAGVASDVTKRREAENRVRDSEARLRRFGEASSDVLWVRNADTLQWEYLSPAFEAVYGLGVDEALAGENFADWLDLILPEDREAAVASIDRVRAGERVTFEYRIRRPDGAVRWLRDTDFPMPDDDGRIARIGGVGQDVTDLKAIDAALQASEAQLRTLTEGIPQLVWRAGDKGRWTWSSRQWQDFTGQSLAGSLDHGWLEAIHPAERETTLAAWGAARAHGRLDVEHRVRRAADGAYLWHHTRSTPLRDKAGRILEWLGTTTDVQEMKELQGRQSVLVAELQHRTRNLIAVVRSVAEQTMATTGPTPAFREQFNDRLEALARVQGLLSRADEKPVTIEGLIRMELNALGAFREAGDRIEIGGPPVRLRSAVVQTLALALHELATNARKHGALATQAGRLSVTWGTSEKGSAGPRLRLEWVESGGASPPPGQAVRRGFGRELIEKALPYSLGAETLYELGPHGVRCAIDMPLGPRERREDVS